MENNITWKLFPKTYQCSNAKRTSLIIPLVPGTYSDSFLLVEKNIIRRSKIYIETRKLWPLNAVHLVLIIRW